MKKLLKNFFRKIKLKKLVKEGKISYSNGTITDKISAYIFLLNKDKKITRRELFRCTMEIFDEQ